MQRGNGAGGVVLVVIAVLIGLMAISGGLSTNLTHLKDWLTGTGTEAALVGAGAYGAAKGLKGNGPKPPTGGATAPASTPGTTSPWLQPSAAAEIAGLTALGLYGLLNRQAKGGMAPAGG